MTITFSTDHAYDEIGVCLRCGHDGVEWDALRRGVPSHELGSNRFEPRCIDHQVGDKFDQPIVRSVSEQWSRAEAEAQDEVDAWLDKS